MTLAAETAGEYLRRARENRGLSLARLATSIAALADVPVTGAAIGGWERGEYAPGSYTVVQAIERVLELDDGDLSVRFGLSQPVTILDRLDALESRCESLRLGQLALADQLRDLLSELRDAPGDA